MEEDRTHLILEKLDDIGERFGNEFENFSGRLQKLETDVVEIKVASAKQDGQKGVVLFIGGLVLAMLGAIGNMVLLWLLGPNGLLHKPPFQN